MKIQRTFSVLAAFVCAFLFFAQLNLAQQTRQVLQNHVPPAVSSGQAAFVTSLPADHELYLSIVLPMRNRAELQDLLNQLYDPSSAKYHQFLKVDQFAEMFGPSAEDYQAVVEFAKANGLSVTGTPADSMSVPVRGTVAQIESAFHISMNVYRHPTEDRWFFSPDREPSLDLSVPIQYISGLNSFSVPRPMASKAASQANANGSGPGGSYLPGDMRAAYYGSSSPLTGSGQCVSLVEFGGYSINDVANTFNGAASWTANGSNYTLSYKAGGVQYSIPIINISVNQAKIGTYNTDEGEVVLDIAQAIGMAPGLNQVRVYFAPDAWTNPSGTNYEFPSSSDDYAILSQMITDFRDKVGCNQASISWNWMPQNPTNPNAEPDNGAFDTMVAVGMSFFAASGDSGSWPNYAYYYPEEYPNLTAVGGTVLNVNIWGGTWDSESGWYWSGGGISPDGFAIPPYQSGLNGINGTSKVYRNAPDVAMEANNDNYVCSSPQSPVCSGSWYGTSFAAPRWAAFMALANQQAANTGKGPIGFLNPTIYAIGGSSNFLTDFHYIYGGGTQVYPDVPGEYTMVTGWGTPQGQVLINALAAAAPPLAASPYTVSATVESYPFEQVNYYIVDVADTTPGATIYYSWSCGSYNGSGSVPGSGGSFDAFTQGYCNIGGEMYATAPGYSPSQSVPIYF